MHSPRTSTRPREPPSRTSSSATDPTPTKEGLTAEMMPTATGYE